jgi:hypothetical protein
MVPMLDPERERSLLVFSKLPFVTGADLHWMLGRFQKSDSERIRQGWQQLIESTLRSCSGYQALDFLESISQVPALVEEFGAPFEAVDLNSRYAQIMRENACTQSETERDLSVGSIVDDPPSARITELLEVCESSDPTAWWRLNIEMLFQEDGRAHLEELEPDVTSLPGWEAATDDTRTRIIRAAKQYVLHGNPETSEWLDREVFHRPALAGYRALLLLLQSEPEFLRDLPDDIWQRWTPAVLAYPRGSGVPEDDLRPVLIGLAYKHAPHELIGTLLALIDKYNRQDNALSIVREVDTCWDERLASELLTRVKSGGLRPKSVYYLLDDLLRNRHGEARRYAESLLSLPIAPEGEAREHAVSAARALLSHTLEASWPVLWPAIQQDPGFGRAVILSKAGDLRWTASGQQLVESDLADLYLWLCSQFPHADDPKHDNEFHRVTPRESVGRWRDTLLRHLVEWGSFAACQAIERIVQEHPELEVPRAALLRAEENLRRMTWQAPRPEDVMRIGADQEARLVNSADDLMDVLIEALTRLEAKLQGETSAARDLWDRQCNGKYRPVDENEFSDYVKRQLDEDLNQRGIVINREVEIRRGTGGDPGERTDLHVDAVVHGAGSAEYDVITVIIEAKGCWNRDLYTAMETQLVDRYLKDNQCQHGIYLVGRFNCSQWDGSDRRRRDAPDTSLRDMQARFGNQASELSRSGMCIKALVMNTSLH